MTTSLINTGFKTRASLKHALCGSVAMVALIGLPTPGLADDAAPGETEVAAAATTTQRVVE